MNINLNAGDVVKYSDVFIPGREQILAICGEQDLHDGLWVRLQDGGHHLGGGHAVQVHGLVLAHTHQLPVRREADLTRSVGVEAAVAGVVSWRDHIRVLTLAVLDSGVEHLPSTILGDCGNLAGVGREGKIVNSACMTYKNCQNNKLC